MKIIKGLFFLQLNSKIVYINFFRAIKYLILTSLVALYILILLVYE